MGVVKSAAGIGALLLKGIGDTIRVSLSCDPVKEVVAAHDILRAVGLETEFVDVVSCPTCGRCAYDCLTLAAKVEARTRGVNKKRKVAECPTNAFPPPRRKRYFSVVWKRY